MDEVESCSPYKSNSRLLPFPFVSQEEDFGFTGSKESNQQQQWQSLKYHTAKPCFADRLCHGTVEGAIIEFLSDHPGFLEDSETGSVP